MSPILFKGYRSGKQQIRHNTYKSDVYSLGVCFLFAASLSFEGPNIIREVYKKLVPTFCQDIIASLLSINLDQKYKLMNDATIYINQN